MVVEKLVEKTPVAELYASGYVAESEVEEILLLKFVQSVDARKPLVDPLACATWMVRPVPRIALVPPVIVRMDEPVSVTFPRATEVMPLVPLPKSTWPEVRVLWPVPPEPTPRAFWRLRVPRLAEAAKRLVELAVVAKNDVEVALANVVAPVKELVPEKVLLFARSEEEAAVIVKVPPAVMVVELMVAREPVR